MQVFTKRDIELTIRECLIKENMDCKTFAPKRCGNFLFLIYAEM